jgi:hypothetical protein
MLRAKDIIASQIADKLATAVRERDALKEALRGLIYLTDQIRKGGMILSRFDGKPITNGDQELIDRAYVEAKRVLKHPPSVKEKNDAQ